MKLYLILELEFLIFLCYVMVTHNSQLNPSQNKGSIHILLALVKAYSALWILLAFNFLLVNFIHYILSEWGFWDYSKKVNNICQPKWDWVTVT